MPKEYASPPFQEVYIIQLPQSVKDDQHLNWTEKVCYWFYVHHKGNNAKVFEELNLTERQFRRIRNKLISRDHLQRTIDNGRDVYTAVDLDTAYWLRIQKFRKVSKVGFQLIGDQNIYTLKKHHTYAHILHVLEVLEWTYRNGNETIKKPHHMLTRSCKTGVTPATDFVPGFWEKDLEEKARNEKYDAMQQYKQAKENEREIMKERHFDEYFKALDPKKQQKMEEQARADYEKEHGAFMAFVTPRMRTMIVRVEMIKKWEVQNARVL